MLLILRSFVELWWKSRHHALKRRHTTHEASSTERILGSFRRVAFPVDHKQALSERGEKTSSSELIFCPTSIFQII